MASVPGGQKPKEGCHQQPESPDRPGTRGPGNRLEAAQSLVWRAWIRTGVQSAARRSHRIKSRAAPSLPRRDGAPHTWSAHTAQGALRTIKASVVPAASLAQSFWKAVPHPIPVSWAEREGEAPPLPSAALWTPTWLQASPQPTKPAKPCRQPPGQGSSLSTRASHCPRQRGPKAGCWAAVPARVASGPG